MTLLQSRRLNAMKYLVKVTPSQYKLEIKDTRLTLMQLISSGHFSFWRECANVDKDFRYLID